MLSKKDYSELWGYLDVLISQYIQKHQNYKNIHTVDY